MLVTHAKKRINMPFCINSKIFGLSEQLLRNYFIQKNVSPPGLTHDGHEGKTYNSHSCQNEN